MTDPEHLLADYNARMAETTRMAEQVRDGLAAVSATARSADGKFAVTVNAAGNVVDLRLPDPDLATTILTMIRRAQSQLADAVRTAMPAELAGSAVLAELDTQYRTSYPEPASDRAPRRSLRLGVEEEHAVEPVRTRRPRPPSDGEEYGDRTLLR